MVGINNLVYINAPVYQQRPLDLLPTLLAENKCEIDSGIKSLVWEELDSVRRIQKRIESNKKFCDMMASIEIVDMPINTVNRFGYMGKYQMGRGAYKDIGYNMSPSKWRELGGLPEEKQDELFLRFCSYNKKALQPLIDRYEGKTIRGIRIHETNIVAAAHGGLGRVAGFLKSNGRRDAEDGNGTPISHYLKKFEGQRAYLK